MMINIAKNCPDCGALVGEPHDVNCDVARCSECGGQRVQCVCEGHDPLLAVWTGSWPGAEACRELGWYAYLDPVTGWTSCDRDHPGAKEHLNRWRDLVDVIRSLAKPVKGA